MRISICGPIEWWWGERWDSPDHRVYVAWRNMISDELVAAGHLVYRPHEAFKGMWDDNDGDSFAQEVNNAAIRMSELVLNLTPLGVTSEGTDDELGLCAFEEIPVMFAPPPFVFEEPALSAALELLRERVAAAGDRGITRP
jgi:hypothetical protein